MNWNDLVKRLGAALRGGSAGGDGFVVGLETVADEALLRWSHLNRALTERAVFHSDLVFRNRDGSSLRSARQSAIAPVEFSEALSQYGTAIIDNVASFLPEANELCQALEDELPGCAVSLNLFASRPGSHTFDRHFDDVDVLVVQLEGTKQWNLYGIGAQRHPIPGIVDRPEDCPLHAQYRAEIGPGDAIWMTRGCWHQVAGTGEASLHASFTFSRPVVGDALSAWARGRTSGHEIYRMNAWNIDGVIDSSVINEAVKEAREGLSELPDVARRGAKRSKNQEPR